jgi:hypothetical protein
MNSDKYSVTTSFNYPSVLERGVEITRDQRDDRDQVLARASSVNANPVGVAVEVIPVFGCSFVHRNAGLHSDPEVMLGNMVVSTREYETTVAGASAAEDICDHEASEYVNGYNDPTECYDSGHVLLIERLALLEPITGQF